MIVQVCRFSVAEYQSQRPDQYPRMALLHRCLPKNTGAYSNHKLSSVQMSPMSPFGAHNKPRSAPPEFHHQTTPHADSREPSPNIEFNVNNSNRDTTLQAVNKCGWLRGLAKTLGRSISMDFRTLLSCPKTLSRIFIVTRGGDEKTSVTGERYPVSEQEFAERVSRSRAE
jgi:hypothetical protein